MKEVVKAQVIMLLDAGIIYMILDDAWVSLVKVVPTKGGMTVVTKCKQRVNSDKNSLRVEGLHRQSETEWCHGKGSFFPILYWSNPRATFGTHVLLLSWWYVRTLSDLYRTRRSRKDHIHMFIWYIAYKKKMLVGLYNAPATFLRCMMPIFTEFVEDIMEVFMDDFSVFGDTSELCLFV